MAPPFESNLVSKPEDWRDQAKDVLRNVARHLQIDFTQGLELGRPQMEIDRDVEERIVQGLTQIAPDAVIWSEEAGVIARGKGSGGAFLVDPLDGSNNFLRGIPIFATALAWDPGGSAEAIALGRVAYALVITSFGDEVEAFLQGGTYLNGHRVARPVTTGSSLSRSIVRLNPLRSPGLLTGGARLLGASIVEAVLLLRGGLDGFVDTGTLKITDVAAPYLFLREAGASVEEVYPSAHETRGVFTAITGRLGLVAAWDQDLFHELHGLLTQQR